MALLRSPRSGAAAAGERGHIHRTRKIPPPKCSATQYKTLALKAKGQETGQQRTQAKEEDTFGDPLSTYLRNRRSQKALKQPLSHNSSDEEVITADHNYSLKNPATAAEQQTEMKEIVQLPKKKLVAARRGLSYRERNVLSVINELVKKKLLSEEAMSLLQAQFSGIKGLG
ncbi:THAP domain-containing protein 9 [Chelonia mydas]|uniref:THAP domain-containing protein 9 n=1 Tax=Chelonia mydas TaxID=8469 RepID=M7B047_CHEMY|nr:THAP domain-containing protein 9 [Chelonia mydas]